MKFDSYVIKKLGQEQTKMTQNYTTVWDYMCELRCSIQR